jgi:TonB-linked SusC/RagA family outer membrane protein
VINESEEQSQFTSFSAEYEIIDGLKAKGFGSWRKVSRSSGYYAPASSTLPDAIDHNGIANISNNEQDEKLSNISLNYTEAIGMHKFSVLGLYEWQRQTYNGNFTQARGFINDITAYHALQLGNISSVLPGDISSYKNDRTLISVLGRANYSFDERYLVTMSYRRDGSSVFGKNNKWGDFPSASIAWRLTEEPFMKEQELFSNLKFRLGYGITGNQQGLHPQHSLQLVGGSGTVHFNGEMITNFNVTQNANEDLRWETRYQTNMGLDFGLFDGNLNGTLDVYSATTKNLLFNYSVPQPPYPYGSIVANVGSLKNEGVELSLNYRLLNTSNWTVSLAGNLSLLRNEVLGLNGSINGIPLNTDYIGMGYNAYLVEGKPIGTFLILEHEGIDAVNAEVVADRDNSGAIDQGDRSGDRYEAGQALPKYTYAFTPSVNYKNFDMSIVLQGSGGNKIYNGIKSSFSYFEKLGKSNMLASATDLNLYTSQYGSDLWLEDGDFLRFENLTIGYNYTPKNSNWLKRMRVFVAGNNLYVWTKYTGLDPEINVSGDNGTGGDGGIYPRTTSISLGLNITL